MGKWLSLSAFILALDLMTKSWVEMVFQVRERLSITPFFDLTLAYNKGAAFSFLANAGGWQRWFFTAIAVVVVGIMLGWLRKLKEDEKWLACALALIMGGALGNLYDRVLYGQVTDFLLFYVHPYYFPAFNVADMAISVGAFMLIVDIFRGGKGDDADRVKP